MPTPEEQARQSIDHLLTGVEVQSSKYAQGLLPASLLAWRWPLPFIYVLTLMDLVDLVKELLEHYERLDADTQRLVPLRKIYWPG